MISINSLRGLGFIKIVYLKNVLAIIMTFGYNTNYGKRRTPKMEKKVFIHSR